MIDLLKEHPITTVKVTEDVTYNPSVIHTVARVLAERIGPTDMLAANVPIIIEQLQPWTPVTKEGKFAKRMSALLHKEYGVDLPSGVTNALAAYLGSDTPSGEFIFDIDKKFGWGNGDFGDEGSCFHGRNDIWSSLRNMGASALRFWSGKQGVYKGAARSLIIPYDEQTPVVVNAYGATLAQFGSRIEAIDHDIKVLPVHAEGVNPVTVNMATGLVAVPKAREVDVTIIYDLPIPYGVPGHNTCRRCAMPLRLRDGRRYDHNDNRICLACAEEHYDFDVLSTRYYPKGELVGVEMAGMPRDLAGMGHDFYLMKREDFYPVPQAVLVHNRYDRVLHKCHCCQHYIYPNAAYPVMVNGGEEYANVCADCRFTKFDHSCRYCGAWLEPGSKCACERRR